LQVDIVRNRIIKYNTFLTMATFGVGITAIVPGAPLQSLSLSLFLTYMFIGIFGMNLMFPESLTDRSDPFYVTCFLITVAVPVIFIILYIIGKRMHCF
jgi:hypothetical protein